MSARLAAVAALLAATPVAVSGQSPWDVTLTVGAAFPTTTLGTTDLQTGFGFEATVGYRFIEHLSGYVGWDWHRFTTDPAQSFSGLETDIEETGYVAGLRFSHPLSGAGSPALQVRGGVTLNHIEVEDDAGGLVTDSGHGLGWEAGAGLELPFGGRWKATPGVRFRSLARDLVVGMVVTPSSLRYLTVEVGLSRSF